MIQVGDPAPDFSAVDCQGRTVSLAAMRGRRVVLFFFPTPEPSAPGSRV